MKILFINGDCVQVNSSANLCHLAYLQGMVDAGYDIDLLSAEGSFYQKDSSMAIPDGVMRYSYSGFCLYERLSALRKGKTSSTAVPGPTKNLRSGSGKRNGLKGRVKKALLSLYGIHGIYTPFLRRARRFRSSEEYDCVISVSTPVSSHALAYDLLKSGRVHGKNWIQIWEDPWYQDVYGTNGPKVYEEEKRLLSVAEKICYVSPITLENQKRLFPEAASKMFWQPLPSYYQSESRRAIPAPPVSYGYFGAYYPFARNLRPFYEAASKMGIQVKICGDPSTLFSETESIQIFPRMSLEALRPYEEATDVLVFLCNRGGGQIPGKVYQYAATDKTVLFILDGTEEEKKILREFFESYHRFVFCENNVEDIAAAIERIQRGELGNVVNRPLTDFDPVKIVSRILEEGMK